MTRILKPKEKQALDGKPLLNKWQDWKKKNKFGARKVSLDGHVFQSRLEADYYIHLKPIFKDALKVHPTVHLVSGIRYKADFAYPEAGRMVYVDTKGDATAAGRFPTICKLWRDFGPGVLKIVYRAPGGGFFTKREIHSKNPNKEG